MQHSILPQSSYDTRIKTTIHPYSQPPGLFLFLRMSTMPASYVSSSYGLLVYDQILRHRVRRATADWEPVERVLVVEGPGRGDDEKGEGGASEGDEDGELDIL